MNRLCLSIIIAISANVCIGQNLERIDSVRLLNSNKEVTFLGDSLYDFPFTLLRFQDLNAAQSASELSNVKVLFNNYRDWGLNILAITSDRFEWARRSQLTHMPWPMLYDSNATVVPHPGTLSLAKNALMNRNFLIGRNLSVTDLEKILHKNLITPYYDRITIKEPE